MEHEDLAEVAPVSHAVFRVARLHKAYAGRLLRESGLHPGQDLVLMSLWARGPQRQVDLAATLESDAPSMARSLTRLERVDLVRRTRSSTDRRSMIVEATEQSLGLREPVTRAWRELEGATVGALTPGQVDDILRSLEVLERTLEEPPRP